MSQELNQEFKRPPSGGATGTTCSKTGLYKASDGKITSVLMIRRGDAFPPFIGATGTTKTTWYAVTEGSDGSRTSFESVTATTGSV